MRKRAVLSFVLAFGFVFSAFGQDFRFVENNGQITITGHRGRARDVVIPERINGVPVVAIGNRAFHYNRLTSVTIPNGVTYIGYRAFGGNRLSIVSIPTGVTHIGDRAFYNNQLTSVTIPSSITRIARLAFYNNRLTSVTIPNGVTYIGYRAFGRNQLSIVSVPNSTNVGNRAFDNATIRRLEAESLLAIDAVLARAINDVSRDLAITSRIAILDVSSSVGERSLAEFITGELELILWRRGFTIVSRSDLDRIRSEQQLGLTGEIDDNTAAGIGRIAGASIILAGGIDGSGDLRRLRLRALDTETGRLIGVTAERI